MRILLLEDDLLIGDGIKVGLEKLGFAVDWFTDGVEGEEALYAAPYDAVILDLGLPQQDGLTVLQKWRNRGQNVPVLILTARGDVDQRIVGLNSGADDYLAKPFSLKEVQARLNALIRRHTGSSMKAELSCGDVVFYPETRKVLRGGKEVALSPRETALLELLLHNRNRVLTKEQIEEKLYSWQEDVSSNAVEVHIHHLRRKLGKNIVRTINRIGYMTGDE